MGKRSIERGSTDTWTVTPRRIDRRAPARRRGRGRRVAGDDDGRPPQRSAGVLCQPAARPGRSRPARLHPVRRAARLPHRHQVRQHADEDRRDRAPRDRRLHRERQGLPGRLDRREGGAGLPPARPRHVRAAGPPARLGLPGRAADPALRQRRLDAGLPDGHPVRPHPRRVRRPVRAADGVHRAEGDGGAARRSRRVSPVRGRERRGADREPPARRRRARVAAIRSTRPAPAPGSSRDRGPRPC